MKRTTILKQLKTYFAQDILSGKDVGLDERLLREIPQEGGNSHHD